MNLQSQFAAFKAAHLATLMPDFILRGTSASFDDFALQRWSGARLRERLRETAPLVSVCAWCWPVMSDYLRAHPEHREAAITHGICPAHAQEFSTCGRQANPITKI